jgi:undecaprenyl diphosphate synthase
MTNIPRSIGIIMDGNRRWAKTKGMPTLEGHRAGYEKVRDVLTWSRESGVQSLIVYAFSTENWNRTAEEVFYLMDLFRTMISVITEDAIKNNMRLIFLGERQRFAPDLLQAIVDAEAATRNLSAFTFGIGLSYGGRTEIVDAIHRIPKEKLETISEEEFSALLWTKEIPDPDLIIRTSGEERLSNFLPWQSVYSELFFTKTLWPDFSLKEFNHILAEYAERDRRRGK